MDRDARERLRNEARLEVNQGDPLARDIVALLDALDAAEAEAHRHDDEAEWKFQQVSVDVARLVAERDLYLTHVGQERERAADLRRELDEQVAALRRVAAERDAALERERVLREALAALSLATEHLQNAIRDGFSDHEWHEEYAGNMLDDAMLECDEALGTADEARAALAATATSEEEQA